MAWPKGKPRPNGAGRQKGGKNKRTLEVERYARSIVDNTEVQATLLQQAKAGTLPAPVMQMFFYYAYGKPVEHVEHGMDQDKPLAVILRRAR